MASRRTMRIAAVAAAASVTAAGLVAAERALVRRWARDDDPEGPDLLCGPEGTDFRVETPDGAVLAGTDCGEGPPVVLAHCWMASRHAWSPVAHQLVERGHRVISYDHRGHGDSTMGNGSPSIDTLAHDLALVMSHLDLSDVVVAGHSMGGMTAMACVGQGLDQGRTAAMALVATTATPFPTPGWVAPVGDRIARVVLGTRLFEWSLAHPLHGAARVRGAVGRTPSYAQLDATRRAVLTTTGPVRAGFFPVVQQVDVVEHLAAIEVPTIVVAGARDRLTPLFQARRIVRHLPHAELVVLDDAGHMLPFEHPDTLADLITQLSAG